MPDSTREPASSYTPPVPPRIPSEDETRRRMAFQAMHPEVGFTFRHRPEPHWLAYWLKPDCKPDHKDAPTLGELVGILKPLFPDQPPSLGVS